MNTVENIEKLPSFVYANFTIRLGAYLIDLLLIRMTTMFVLNLYDLLNFPTLNGAFNLQGVIKLLLYLLYFTIITKLLNGQTLGKMIFGLRVVSSDHSELTWNDVFIREFVGRYIQKKIKVLYFLVLLSTNKQSAADFFTDTNVISEKNYVSLQDYISISNE